MVNLVSILIPTFNRAVVWDVEQLKSESLILNLINQTYSNIEIIIINDGSTDTTETHLDYWSKKDQRIKVINKKNGGVSNARNSGIDIATGDYLFFVDDDDIIPIDYIEKFMKNEYENFDLIIDSFSKQTLDEKPKEIIYPEINNSNQSETLDQIFKLENLDYAFFLPAKRFNLNIIKNNKIKFNEKITLGEDRLFILEYILSNDFRNSKIINNHLYIFKTLQQSDYKLSHGHSHLKNLFINFEQTYYYLLTLEEKTHKKYIKKYADNYLIDKLSFHILIPYALKKNKRDEDIPKQKINYIIKKIEYQNIQRKLSKLVLFFLKVTSFSFTLLVLKSYLKYRKNGKRVRV